MPTPPPTPPPAIPTPPNPWIESREGVLVFTNSLFVFPYLLVLIPLVTRVIGRGLMGRFPEPSTVIDTFPGLAEYFLPTTGWLAVLPLALTLRNFPKVTNGRARVLLIGFSALHGMVLGWTVLGWIGAHDGALPGGL
jgi:hypothetical protein